MSDGVVCMGTIITATYGPGWAEQVSPSKGNAAGRAHTAAYLLNRESTAWTLARLL